MFGQLHAMYQCFLDRNNGLKGSNIDIYGSNYIELRHLWYIITVLPEIIYMISGFTSTVSNPIEEHALESYLQAWLPVDKMPSCVLDRH